MSQHCLHKVRVFFPAMCMRLLGLLRRLKMKLPKLGTSCTTICMNRQYKRRHKKKDITRQLFRHSSGNMRYGPSEFPPSFVSSFSPPFRTHALALDFLILSTAPPRHCHLIPELNSQRKRSMKGVPGARGNSSKG